MLRGWNGKIQVEKDGTNTWEEGFSDSKQLYLVKEVSKLIPVMDFFPYWSFQNKYLAKVQIEKLYCKSNMFFKYK